MPKRLRPWLPNGRASCQSSHGGERKKLLHMMAYDRGRARYAIRAVSCRSALTPGLQDPTDRLAFHLPGTHWGWQNRACPRLGGIYVDDQNAMVRIDMSNIRSAIRSVVFTRRQDMSAMKKEGSSQKQSATPLQRRAFDEIRVCRDLQCLIAGTDDGRMTVVRAERLIFATLIIIPATLAANSG